MGIFIIKSRSPAGRSFNLAIVFSFSATGGGKFSIELRWADDHNDGSD